MCVYFGVCIYVGVRELWASRAVLVIMAADASIERPDWCVCVRVCACVCVCGLV